MMMCDGYSSKKSALDGNPAEKLTQLYEVLNHRYMNYRKNFDGSHVINLMFSSRRYFPHDGYIIVQALTAHRSWDPCGCILGIPGGSFALFTVK